MLPPLQETLPQRSRLSRAGTNSENDQAAGLIISLINETSRAGG
jgi:hypothetical protein